MDFLKQHKNEIIVGIICSLIVSTVFYFINLQKVNMKYSLKTVPISSTRKQGGIIYNNEYLDSLSMTLVTIINDGNKALNGKQMLKKAPFTVYLNQNYKIIGVYKREKNTTKSLDYSFDINKNRVIINFDVLNPSDRLGFTIIHTGTSDEDIAITGKWENYNGFKQLENHYPIMFYVLVILFIIAILYIVLDKFLDNKIVESMKELRDFFINCIDEDEFEIKK